MQTCLNKKLSNSFYSFSKPVFIQHFLPSVCSNVSTIGLGGLQRLFFLRRECKSRVCRDRGLPPELSLANKSLLSKKRAGIKKKKLLRNFLRLAIGQQGLISIVVLSFQARFKQIRYTSCNLVRKNFVRRFVITSPLLGWETLKRAHSTVSECFKDSLEVANIY